MSQTPDPLRLSDLLGARIVEGSSTLGTVVDVRLERISTSDEIVVTALRSSTARYGTSLGYGRRQQRGPWIISRLLRRLHRDDRWIPWTAVDTISEVAGGGCVVTLTNR